MQDSDEQVPDRGLATLAEAARKACLSVSARATTVSADSEMNSVVVGGHGMPGVVHGMGIPLHSVAILLHTLVMLCDRVSNNTLRSTRRRSSSDGRGAHMHRATDDDTSPDVSQQPCKDTRQRASARPSRHTYVFILARRRGEALLGVLIVALLVDLALLIHVAEEDLLEKPAHPASSTNTPSESRHARPPASCLRALARPVPHRIAPRSDERNLRVSQYMLCSGKEHRGKRFA